MKIYQSWEEAERASIGYADGEILARTRTAILKVKRGEAAFERDSVTFQVMEYRFPLLAGLLRAAAASGGRLSVLDFGGALGSIYFQCRQFFVRGQSAALERCGAGRPRGVWPSRIGRPATPLLPHVEECVGRRPNLLLLSGVLQCLPQPYVMLESLLRLDWIT